MTYYNVQDSIYIATSNSNVGIGITNPSNSLSISGDVNLTTSLKINGTQVLGETTLGSGIVNSSLTSLGAQAENLNMGDYQITGAKKIYLDSDSVTNKVNLTRSDNSASGFIIKQATTQVVTMSQTENANMDFQTNNTTRLRLSATGDINAMSNNITDVADISFTSATIKGHMIPDTDDTYDIGSASYKIRDMYVSDNSMWVGDTHKISISGGKMKFRKRKTTSVPAAIIAAAQAADASATASSVESAAISHASVVNLAAMKLKHWKAYMRTISNQSSATIQDIFRDNADDYADQTSAENWLESGTKTYNKVGNVGIGTSDPSALLSLHYDPESSQGLKELMRLSWHDANYDTLKGDGVKISFHQPDTNNFPGTEEAGYFGVMKSNAVEADKESDITIANNDGTNIVERIRILANGDVGIGDATPSYKLDVAGDINFTGTLRQNGSAYSSGAFTESSGEAYYTGNVGIGLTDPAVQLDIFGTKTASLGQMRVQDSASFAIGTGGRLTLTGYYTAESLLGNAPYIEAYKEDATSGNYGFALAFGSRSNGSALSEKMRISGSGNVGIGTNAPDALLHVSGTTNPVIARVSTSDNQTARLELCESTAGQHGGYMEYRGGDSDRVKIGVINQYTDTAALTINENGNVGIGAASPNYKLVVAGDINLTGDLRVNGVAQSFGGGSSVWSTSGNSATYSTLVAGDIGHTSAWPGIANSSIVSGTAYALIQNSVGETLMNSASGQKIGFREGNVEKMTIKSGNVGIGNTSPQELLHISSGLTGANCPSIRIENTLSGASGTHVDTEYGSIDFWTADGNVASGRIVCYQDGGGTAPDCGLKFYVNENSTQKEALYIDYEANVSIGKGAMATAKLEVVGDILASSYIRGQQHMCDIEIDGSTNTSSPDLYENKLQGSGAWRDVYLKHTRTDTSIPKVGMEYLYNRSFAINVGFNDSTTTNSDGNSPTSMYKLQCTVKGLYQFHYSLKMLSTSASEMEIIAQVNRTGTWHGYSRRYQSSAGKNDFMTGSGVVRMNANDYLVLRCKSSSGTHYYDDGRIQVCMIGTY